MRQGSHPTKVERPPEPLRLRQIKDDLQRRSPLHHHHLQHLKTDVLTDQRGFLQDTAADVGGPLRDHIRVCEGRIEEVLVAERADDVDDAFAADDEGLARETTDDTVAGLPMLRYSSTRTGMR